MQMRNHLSIDGSIEQKCVATGRQSIEVSIFFRGAAKLGAGCGV